MPSETTAHGAARRPRSTRTTRDDTLQAAEYADHAGRHRAADYAEHAERHRAADSSEHAERRRAAEHAEHAERHRQTPGTLLAQRSGLRTARTDSLHATKSQAGDALPSSRTFRRLPPSVRRTDEEGARTGCAALERLQIFDQVLFLLGCQPKPEERVVVFDEVTQRGETPVVIEAALRVRPQTL